MHIRKMHDKIAICECSFTHFSQLKGLEKRLYGRTAMRERLYDTYEKERPGL